MSDDRDSAPGRPATGSQPRASRAQPRASRAQLRAVVENIDEGLVIADRDGNVLTINQRAREMIGYDPDDIERRYHVSDFPRYLRLLALDGRELRPEERPMARLMAGERFSDYELRCVRVRTGTEWIASFVGTPVRAADGSVELAVLSGRDITERKRAEEALHEAARQKDAFIAALAHELRNPLAPILTAAELLARDDAATDRGRRLAETIARQAAHLARIVDDLLDVSRVTSGRVVLRREPLDLGALVAHTVEDHRPTFTAAEVDLVIDTPADRVWVDGDPTRLAQVVENLLSNALKFTDAGGRVSVTVQRIVLDRVALVVRDTGIGIEPQLQATLWDVFSQGERSPVHGSAGLGLGTALIKALTELHGGDVSVSSAGPGRGSEFTVTLPVARGPVERHGARPVSAPAQTGRPGPSVLVVEDNADVADVLAGALRELGSAVRVAADGEAGVRIARAWSPSAVLCDIGLPGAIDGYEVARELRATGYQGMLVAVSGYGRAEDRERAMAAGFNRHMTKPVSMESIEQLLGSIAPR